MLHYYYLPRPATPSSVIEATKKSVLDVDDIQSFIESMCDLKGRCSCVDLYEAYRANGGETSQRMFGKAIGLRIGAASRAINFNGSVQRGYIGICLKDDQPADDIE